jgi:integrase
MKTTADPRTGVISVLINGQKINTGTTDRKEARRIVDIASQLAPHAHQVGLGKAPTVSEAIAEWHDWMKATAADRTAACHLSHVQKWATDLKLLSRPLPVVQEHHISDHVNIKGPIQASSRQTRLSAIRSFFKFAMIKRYIAQDPSQLVRVKFERLTHRQKEKIPNPPLTDDEIKNLLAFIKASQKELSDQLPEASPLRVGQLKERLQRFTFWKLAVSIGRAQGFRLGDIAQLEWDTIRVRGGIVVWTDKTNKRVELPFALADMLKEVEESDPVYMFPVQRETYLKAQSHLSIQFSRLCLKAGIGAHNFHQIRKTHATARVQSGDSVEQVAKDLGHSSTKTTRKHYLP